MSDPLEARLSAVVFETVGEHLSEWRIAQLGEGGEPSDEERLHLAGCTDCAEVLVLLSEGLAAMAPAPVLRFSRPSRPRRAAVFTGVLLGFAAAAALFSPLGLRSDRPPVPVERIASVVKSPVAPLSVAAPPVAPPSVAVSSVAPPSVAVSSVAPPSVAVSSVAPPSVAVSSVAPPSVASPPIQAPATPIAEPPRPSPPTSAPKKPRPQTHRPRQQLKRAQIASPHGPNTDVRLPISGAPRGYGYLRLTSKPPAEVWVDGEPIGWTPIIDRRLPEGPHDVELKYASPLAAASSQRLRVIIEPDKIWKVVQRNLLRDAR